MVDRQRLRHKIQFVRDGLRKLKVIQQYPYDQFATEPFVADACLRNLQVIIEALIDIGSHIVAREGLGMPKTYAEVMRLLVDNGIIDTELGGTYTDMVRFRNRIVHLYDDVSMREVYSVLQHNLPDFQAFVASVTRAFLPRDE